VAADADAETVQAFFEDDAAVPILRWALADRWDSPDRVRAKELRDLAPAEIRTRLS
jgi:hypothetical protein